MKCANVIKYRKIRQFDVIVVWQNQWPDLGHIIDNRSDNGAHISLKGIGLIHWWARLKTFVLRSQVGALPKLKLLKSYCSSLYGCELWNLFNAANSDVCIAWRKDLRRV